MVRLDKGSTILPTTNSSNIMVPGKFIDLISKYRRCAYIELRGFLENKLPTLSTDWWETIVLNKLSYYSNPTMPEFKREHYSAWEKMDTPSLRAKGFDLACLLDILDANWYQIYKRCGFEKNDIRFVKGMHIVRVRNSHDEEYNADEIYREFDTIQCFLRMINVKQDIIDELQEIKYEIDKIKFGVLSAQEPDPQISLEEAIEAINAKQERQFEELKQTLLATRESKHQEPDYQRSIEDIIAKQERKDEELKQTLLAMIKESKSQEPDYQRSLEDIIAQQERQNEELKQTLLAMIKESKSQEPDPQSSELVDIRKELQEVQKILNKPQESDSQSSAELTDIRKELKKVQEILSRPQEPDPQNFAKLADLRKDLQNVQRILNKSQESDSQGSEELAGVKEELQKMQKILNKSQKPDSNEPPRQEKKKRLVPLLLITAIAGIALSIVLAFILMERPDITWAATVDSSTNTTAINFNFDASVSRFIVSNITITDGTGSVTMGALTGNRRSRSLEILVERAGTVYITIDRLGIETRTEMLIVHPITWIVDADSATDTTAISFSFGAPVSGLTANDITVTDGTAAITTGALTGGGSSWSLQLAVANPGNISVSIARPGIEGRTETVNVHPITWAATANSATDTTAINLNFGVPVSGLTANDIIIIDGTATVTAGALTGSGMSWSLELAVANAGDIAVSIAVAGIEYRTGTVEVHPVTWIATAVGTPATTRIHFTFGAPVAGLTPDDITIADGIGLAQATLTGSGTSWSLPITVTGSSYVSVSITRTGIEERAETLAVHPIAWTAATDSSMDTTTISFSFDVPVSGLTVDDVTIIARTGSATAEALIGDGASWSLAVAVTSPGDVEVSISRSGIEDRTETIEVHPITWTATTIGFPTTAIDFTFGVPVSNLTVSDITIPDGIDLVTKGNLTGSGRSWSLAIDVTATSLSSISASISSPGIENRIETMVIRPTIWVANTVGVPATTDINFTFDAPISGLTIDDITIVHETGFVTKGNLTGSGRSWSLPIAVTRSGYVSVSISRPGIEERTEIIATNPITWNAAAAIGTPTTAINFTFDAPVSELTIDDIAIVGIPNLVGGGLTFGPDLVKGNLTGGGKSWSLAIDVIGTMVGNVSVSIIRNGIDSRREEVEIWPLIWAATANSPTNTTAINLSFDAPVLGLTTDKIIVTDGTTEVTTGALTGNGRWWSLEVTVARAGNVNVSIAKPGIEGSTLTVDVNPVTWSAITTAGTPAITGIYFNFGADISGLTANDITIDGGIGLVKGVLTGGGKSWSLPVSVTRSGYVSVSISRPGIEERTETVAVFRNMVSTGSNHSVFVRADGSLWAWGANTYGQLGDATTANRNSPIRVATNYNWAFVSAGLNHTMAIRTDGSLWGWGNNAWHQLGDDTNKNRNSPVRIGTDYGWAFVSAGANHTVAIKTDGSLWAWGSNAWYQLGDDTSENRNSPVRIGTDYDWAYASAGWNHTAAVRKDASLWAWGNNSGGQFGSTAIRYSRVPRQVGHARNWASVSAGGDFVRETGHTLAIRADGSLWAGGNNYVGQLGDGSRTQRTLPTRIGRYTNWASVSTGSHHTVAVRADGTLWAWGNNADGLLGDGTRILRTSPVQIGTARNWVSVSASYGHTVAIREDGSLWAWGENQYGQLGNGTVAQRSFFPVPIVPATPLVVSP